MKVLITTLGGKGSIIETKDKKIATSPAAPHNNTGVVDPTGAGDAYRAGFLAGYLKGLDLKICGQIGSIASCYAIEKYGTTNHRFTLEEFTKKYEQNYHETLFIL